MSRSRMLAGLVAVYSTGVAFASAPVVSNVQFRQDAQTRAVTLTYELDAPAIVKCPQCGEYKRAHRLCASCGYYGGKQIIAVGE